MSAFNGAGVFVISGVGLPYVTATIISSTVANQLNNDLAAGLSNCIAKDGQSTPTGNIKLGGFRLTNVGNPVANGDALVQGGPATVSSLTVAGGIVGVSNANKIINGDFRINQRFGNIATLPGGTNPISDRWAAVLSAGSKLQFQTFNLASATPGVKFTSFQSCNCVAAYVPLASEVFSIRQVIEGLNCIDLDWGFAPAKAITLSFQMYTNLAGLYTGVVRNSAGDRTYVWSYNNTTPNTWVPVSITIPGDVTGTWKVDTGAGMFIEIVLAAGAGVVQPPGAWYGVGAYGGTGQVNLLATLGNAVSFTAVKVEVGGAATVFEPDDAEVSLAKCQRYFFKTFDTDLSVIPPQAGCMASAFSTKTTANGLLVNLRFPVAMRAPPTVITPAPAIGGIGFMDETSVLVAAAAANIGTQGCTIGSTGAVVVPRLGVVHAYADAEL